MGPSRHGAEPDPKEPDAKELRRKGRRVAYGGTTMRARGDQFVSSVDLNADLGETEGDTALLAVVTSASVACGVHAGDPSTMRRAVREAFRRGVAVGAHPSYSDRDGFGRREVGVSAEQVADEVCYQVGALRAIAELEGGSVAYVKLHGALYHRAAVDEEVAVTLAKALAAIGRFSVLGQARSAFLQACESCGLATASEAFCDRAYRSDGNLVDRAVPGAVLKDPERVAAQAVAIALRR
ncbi:MAG TPA: 5-oxoprolinase subunit PxpA, partial [Acidimicrobiales bacterium]|nr:5-oxoprolinase subunit PxpA [Acidimicrobiales bacterium]